MKNLISTTVYILTITALLSTVPSLADNSQALKSREHQSKAQISHNDNAARISEERTATHGRKKVTDIEMLKKSLPKQKTIRDPNRGALPKSLDFEIASAYVTLLYDADYDGYYSEFSVNFDADTSFSFADVYAELYLSLNGGPWELYHITDVFEIQSNSYYDDYTVSTVLSEGYPPGSYDILIDLIDTYDGSWVATIGPSAATDLYALPLEDSTYDNSVIYNSDVTLFDAYINLLSDTDNDGFYKTFSLVFDADVEYGVTEIYAEIWMRDGSGDWFLETLTEDFLIDGNSSLDTYILETTLESGYATGYYDFKIDIFDAGTGDFLTSSDTFDYQLALVPLEDANADRSTASGTTTTITTSTISVESGGAGTSGGVILFITFAAGLLRRLSSYSSC